MSAELDKAQIRELIERWVILRDMGLFDRLWEVWHPDGLMAASWREGTAAEFITANAASFDKGLDILHQLGGSLITISDDGKRAVSLTKMVISQRAPIHGVLCDVHAQARHFDLWEKRERWGLLERRTIFDRDRIDPVNAGEVPRLDQAKLEEFPANYRHLAYLQSTLGYPVRRNLPHLRDSGGAAALYQAGERYLADGARPQ